MFDIYFNLRYKAAQLNRELEMDNYEFQLELIRERIQDVKDTFKQEALIRCQRQKWFQQNIQM